MPPGSTYAYMRHDGNYCITRSPDMRFLTMFQDNKTLGKDALKFAKHFKVSIKTSDTATVGAEENWYTAGTILERHGQRVGDFPGIDAALNAVRHLCKQNQALNGYDDKDEQKDDDYPQFSKFWFVFSKGKHTTHTQEVSKELDQRTDLKTIDQLQQAKVFMEGLGFHDTLASSNVHIEHEHATECKKACELLK